MTDDRITQNNVERYLAWDEGCIECGEPSGALGFFASKEEAEAECQRAEAVQGDRSNWTGQHHFYVIDLHDPDMSKWARESVKT